MVWNFDLFINWKKKILITNISYLSRGFILPAFHNMMTFYIFLRKNNQKIKQIKMEKN